MASVPGLDILGVQARATSPRIAAPNCHSSWPPCPICSNRFCFTQKSGVPWMNSTVITCCCGNVVLNANEKHRWIHSGNRSQCPLCRPLLCLRVVETWVPCNRCKPYSDMREDGHKGGTASCFPLQHQPWTSLNLTYCLKVFEVYLIPPEFSGSMCCRWWAGKN